MEPVEGFRFGLPDQAALFNFAGTAHTIAT